MRKQVEKAVQKPSRTRTKSSKPAVSVKKAGARNKTCAENDKSSERFVRDLLVRGEASKPNRAGKVPLDATHAIIKENPDGTVEVKRVRYKAF
jgi:hypothetical protein